MRFSQRQGHTPIRDIIQLNDMDSDLRNSLWNALETCYWLPLGRGVFLNGSKLQLLCRELWIDFFKRPVDTLPSSWEHAKREIRRYFLETANWYEVYDFVEFIAQSNFDRNSSPQAGIIFESIVNEVLEREISGYRFVGASIVPITDQTELEAIETAVGGGNQAVSGHLNRSLELLSNRQSPDYRNSVKESISAVEGQVRSTLGTEKGSLGDLLKQLEQNVPLHPALKEAFNKLYGYTSDESGIRHSLLEGGREVTFEEAKFMLVVCSAFINYIRGNAKS